jgi:hypothetical protein
MLRRLLLVVAFAAVVSVVGASAAGAVVPPGPTGERTFHNASLEPAWNAANAGQLGFILTPPSKKSTTTVNANAWAPIYVVEYPDTSYTEAFTTVLSCIHVPVEVCPSHGNAIAGLAQTYTDPNNPTQAADVRAVYADGILGHDHVLDFPGGDDFNIAWEPVVVLFTNETASRTRLLTDTAILAAVQSGNAVLVPLPSATFNCAVVPQKIWDMATPDVPLP